MSKQDKTESKTSGAKTSGTKKAKKRKKGSFLKDFIGISLYLLSVLVLAFLLVNYVVQRTVVEGESMEPTFYDGDNLLVDKINYRFHEPKRFDTIVFPYGYDADTYYIKRIIGLPGETVFINDAGDIFINGEKLEESYGNEIIENPGLASDSVNLASDEYFVLGDNRNHSSDSRTPTIGPVKRSQIVGRTFFRTYPFSSFGKTQ